MLEKLDAALEDLVELTLLQIHDAKTKKYFNKDVAEGVCIVLSMAYGRWGNVDKQTYSASEHRTNNPY